MSCFSLEEKLKLYFEILLQPAIKMAALYPGQPMYCLPLTMMMTDLHVVCETNQTWLAALGRLGTRVSNEYQEEEYSYAVETLYTTGERLGYNEGYGPYPETLEPVEINHIHQIMKALVKRYCDLANDYLPTLCQTYQVIDAWHTYKIRYYRNRPADGDQLTAAWDKIAKYIRARLWPNVTPSPLDNRDLVQLRELGHGFLDELEAMVDQLPDEIFCAV